jgi:proteasome accessory factor C
MPSVGLTNQDLFGISLSISGYLQTNNNQVTVEQACEHFDISKTQLRKLISTLFTLENLKTTDFYFDFDLHAFDKKGILRLNRQALITDPPKLSNQQVSALAMGLEYLSNFENLADDEDLNSLMKIFGASKKTVGAVNAKGEMLAVLREAIMLEKQIECDYINTKGERAKRVLEPLRIDLFNGLYYLRAYCPKNTAVRSFRLDRMKQPQLLEEAISKQAKKASLSDEINLATEVEKVVVVEVDRQAKDFFRSFSSKESPELIDGKLRGKIFTGDYISLARHVIARAGKVRVVSPKEAVSAVATAARELTLTSPADED